MKPFDNYEDPINGAMSEIGSASSSLLMYPEFKKGYDQNSEEFLSDIELNAEHAREHLLAAYKLLTRLANVRRDFEYSFLFKGNEEFSKRYLLNICEALNLSKGIMGIIDPCDHSTFEYINETDFNVENAWNLWINEVCQNEVRHDRRHCFILCEEEDDDEED